MRILVLPLALALAATTGQAQNGKPLSMTMTMSMSSPKQPAPVVMMAIKTQLSSNGMGRSDFLSTDSAGSKPAMSLPGDTIRAPILQPGTYSIGKLGNDTTRIVDPAHKIVWIRLNSDSKKLMANAQATVNSQMTNVDVSAARVQPDSTVEGITVEHWRVIDNHVQTTKFMGYSNSNVTKNTYDFYVAPGFDMGASGWDPASAMPHGGADSAYNAKLKTAMTTAMKGMPLAMRMQVNMVDNKGKTTSIGMSMKATNISRSEPPASIFVIPAGYRVKREPPPVVYNPGAGTTAAMPGMPKAGADTTHKNLLDTAGKAAGTDAANSANDAVKAKIKSAIHFP